MGPDRQGSGPAHGNPLSRSASASRAQLTAPPFSPIPYVRACVVAVAGLQSCRRTGLLRQLTYRSCLSGARSAKRVLRHTPHPAQRRSPVAKRRVVGSAGRASLLPFLSRDKKGSRPPGRNPAPARRQGKQQKSVQKISPDQARNQVTAKSAYDSHWHPQSQTPSPHCHWTPGSPKHPQARRPHSQPAPHSRPPAPSRPAHACRTSSQSPSSPAQPAGTAHVSRANPPPRERR